MPHLFSPLERPLPDTLRQDLQTLLLRDNHSYLLWVRETQTSAESAPWFKVIFRGEEGHYSLRLEFAIPGWMDRRGVAAILPASRSVADCRRGEWAAVNLDEAPFRDLFQRLPRVARTCARLMNELWGPTETHDMRLEELAYLDQLSPTPFPKPGVR